MFYLCGLAGRGEEMVSCVASRRTCTRSSICVSVVHVHLLLMQMECLCRHSPAACTSEDAHALQTTHGPLVVGDPSPNCWGPQRLGTPVLIVQEKINMFGESWIFPFAYLIAHTYINYCT